MSNSDYHKSIQQYRNSLSVESVSISGSQSSASVTEEIPKKLALLADSQREGEQRLTALLWLKAQSMTHETAEQWQPQFLDAMRHASDAEHDALRHQAIETLIQHNDSETKQGLLQGLESANNAKTSAAHALRLLSSDSHTSAHEVARKFAQQNDDVDAKEEALRVLANDPSFVEDFAGLVSDDTQPDSIRSMAATALNNLDQERLMSVAESMDNESSGFESASLPSNIKLHLNELLKGK